MFSTKPIAEYVSPERQISILLLTREGKQNVQGQRLNIVFSTTKSVSSEAIKHLKEGNAQVDHEQETC